MSSVVTAPKRAASRSGMGTVLEGARRAGVTGDAALSAGLAAGLVLVAFVASGGTDVGPNTWVQIGLVVVAAAMAVAVLLFGGSGRAWGAGALGLFAALAALTYASIGWSVQPAISWLEANRTLSYLAAFGIGVALARLAPGRWRALLGAVAVVTTLTSLYALTVKVFPGTLDPNDPLGRLRAPFDYWNATGLMAAMGIPACLWAGARREPARVLRSLAPAAVSIQVAAMVLSYSRGAIAVAVVGLGVWFVLVPLRLRGALILALGAAGGAAIAGWALATHPISADFVAASARASAGHAFALVLIVVLLAMVAAGLAAAFALDRVALADGARHRIGTVLVGLVALVPVGGVVALAGSSRGLTGEVSHIWSTLTNPNGGVTPEAGRLVDLSNTRGHYWSESLTIGEHHLLAGSGALGFETAQLHYSTVLWNVKHAHSYVFETFADFGLIGVAVSLALLLAWAIAAQRGLGLRRSRPRGHALRAPPDGGAGALPGGVQERAGLLTLFAVVLTFGVHSMIDWTWFIPGIAVTALVCAGWLAGRGPLAAPVGRAEHRRLLSRSPGAGLLALSAVIIALAASWFIVQPLRSADAVNAGESALIQGNSAAALTDARQALASDPVSIDPLTLESTIYTDLGDLSAARGELVKAVALQPANPQTWQQLGDYDLGHHRPQAAVAELERAYRLDPGSTVIAGLIAQARAATARKT